MKSYPVDATNFKYNKITLHTGGVWKGAAFRYDNQDIKWKKNKAIVKDDNGNEVEVSKTSNPFDPSPWISIEGVKYRPMGSFSVVEQVFIYLPLGLIGIGGAIGGGLGAFASMTNASLMREYKDSYLKYALSLFTCFVASLIWYMTASMINLFLNK